MRTLDPDLHVHIRPRPEGPGWRPMRVAVVGGAGYVGLITGVGLAAIGHEVVSVDVDEARLNALQLGSSPYREEYVEPTLRACLAAGRLRFTTSLEDAVRHGDVIVVAVGTLSRDGGGVDLSQVVTLGERLAEVIDRYTVVVIKSTVPVGTIDLLRTALSRARVEGEEFEIAANPEFMREGSGLMDFFLPARIVIGTRSARARAVIRGLYDPIVRGDLPLIWAARNGEHPVPVIETGFRSALMIKYATNAFLATRVSFINEIAGICERVGADIGEVIHGLAQDLRIGGRYLSPGLGFGGPCLEKDLTSLIRVAEAFDYDPHVLRAALERNDRQVDEAVRKLKQLVGYLLYRRIVAVFGLAFKPGTNDVRNSMSLRLVRRLVAEGAIVRGHDPVATQEAAAALPELDCREDPYEAAHAAEAVIIATEWPAFRDLDFSRLRARMLRPRILDARNLLEREKIRALGFEYQSVGGTCESL